MARCAPKLLVDPYESGARRVGLLFFLLVVVLVTVLMYAVVAVVVAVSFVMVGAWFELVLFGVTSNHLTCEFEQSLS